MTVYSTHYYLFTYSCRSMSCFLLNIWLGLEWLVFTTIETKYERIVEWYR